MAGFRLATYQSASGPRAGIIMGETMFDAAAVTGHAGYGSVLAILEDWSRASDLIGPLIAKKAVGGWPLAQTHLRAPILWPSAIYCAGANYRDHAIEMAQRMNRPLDKGAHLQNATAKLCKFDFKMPLHGPSQPKRPVM